MQETRKYRIRTAVGSEDPTVLNVALEQTYDELEILSLKLTQENTYKLYNCGYGVVVGRVVANGNYGVPNAKISIFVAMDGSVAAKKLEHIYNFSTPFQNYSSDGSQYNLLPDFVDKACHQDVGSFKSKRTILDNNDEIEIFDKYYRYTTTTNEAGDYMLYGVPTGQQIMHMDVDLSDIGILSQTPRDMMYQGYSLDLFESPTKFKKSNDLNELVQIKRSDRSIYIEPFWGDTTESSNPNNVSVNRVDFKIDYTFKPTCIFMGSLVSDKGSEYIGRNCKPTNGIGRLSEFGTGSGLIEMIRYTPNGKIEQATVKGEKLIDDNGVWCYQIPMNLDYMMTDEFGNKVPTDDPEKGIPTRARVRFRISMDDLGGEASTTKRARYLVPCNPEITYDATKDSEQFSNLYEFGSYTRDEDFRDLFWNCVYTVKSFIPRLQKTKSPSTRKFTGIKMVNRFGDNNPMPYNSLSFRLDFRYRVLCVLSRLFIKVIYNLNIILTTIGWNFKRLAEMTSVLSNVIFYSSLPLPGGFVLRWLAKGLCACEKNPNDADEDIGSDDTDDGGINWWRDMKICGALKYPEQEEVMLKSLCGCFYYIYVKIGAGIGLNGLCDNNIEYHPGCNGKWLSKWLETPLVQQQGRTPSNTSNRVSDLFDCVENGLAQENEVTSFNFNNDWINGVLYFPLWFRYVKPKLKVFFNQITIKEKDRWCDYNQNVRYRKLKLYKTCSLKKTLVGNSIKPYEKENFPNPQYDPYIQIPEQDVVIGYGINGYDETNCYGYKCHKKAISFVNNLPGMIVQQETSREENVYYYVAGEIEELKGGTETKQYVKMFSTDIVLLGSLHNCDLQGIPQFFKSLSSTTYNMPPDIFLSDGDIVDENVNISENEFDDENDVYESKSEYTEATGADWGTHAGPKQCRGITRGRNYRKNDIDLLWPNTGDGPGKDSPEKYADGGLFYGLTCSNAYTKPKSCINLERICEYGVNSDVAKYITNENGEYILIPDGYISYDEIYDNDGRSAFATMNCNNLSTVVNMDTGFPVYDFTNLYVDNFDGTAKNLMDNMKCKCQFGNQGASIENNMANYFYNYAMENNSRSYTRFRYGEDISLLGRSNGNNKFIVAGLSRTIDSTIGYISPQNSFYFYFGLKSGKTAIDRFMSDYFSVCDSDDTEQGKYQFDYKPNSWCGNGYDGYISIYLNHIDAPYSVEFNPMNSIEHYKLVENLNSEKIYFGYCPSCNDNGYVQVMENNVPLFLENDIYNVIVTDANDVETEFRINFLGSGITSIVQGFGNESTNSHVYSGSTPPTYNDVALQNSRYPNQGGYIKIYVPYFEDNSVCNYFKVKVSPHNANDFPLTYGVYNGVEFMYYDDDAITPNTPAVSQLWGTDTDDSGFFYVVGIPKNNVRYDIEITQLCCDDSQTPPICTETENKTTITVYVREATPLKMVVNGIDYDVIKNFSGGWDYSSSSITFNINNLIGWDNLADIGVYIESDDVDWDDGTSVGQYVASLRNVLSTSKYNWPNECKLMAEMLIDGCITVSSMPLNMVVNADSPEYVSWATNFYHKEQQSNQWVYVQINYSDYYNDLVLNNETEQLEEIKRNIIYVVESRKELSKHVRAAFTKGYDEYEMNIAYSGGYGLIKHSISYQYEFEYDLLQHYLNETADRWVTGQTIPTLRFGQYNNQITPTRKTYLFGVTDSVGASLPNGFDGETIENPPISLDREHMFQAHMLEKGMSYNFEVWAPISNYPFYTSSFDASKPIINWEGFIAMKITNGISTSLKFENASFDVQRTYPNEKPFNVVTLNPGSLTDTHLYESKYNEDRYISLDNSSGNYSSKNFSSYKIYTTLNDTKQFLPFNAPTSEFNITNLVLNDSLTEYNISLYPEFQVILNEDESYVCSHNDYMGITPHVDPYFVMAFSFNGYEPNFILFYDDTNNIINVGYPVFPMAEQETPTLDANQKIYKWGNYNEITNTNYLYDNSLTYDPSIATVENLYSFKSKLNTMSPTTYGVSVYTIGNGIYYALTPRYSLEIWDIDNLSYDSSTNKTSFLARVSENLHAGGATIVYIKNYPYHVLIYDQNNPSVPVVDDAFEPSPSFDYVNGETITLNTSGDYTNGYDIYIKDITGLRHKLN